jgi:hypothetical protein
MAFITPESGVCLSNSGVTVYPFCGDIIEESGKYYIWTEDGRRILTDDECGSPGIPSFNCYEPASRQYVETGMGVVISNTCTLPITITGFKNSDPERFSIFKYPDYIGQSVYSSGNTSELPATIKPYDTLLIPTFFHPLQSELLHGNAGTFDRRTGDKFGAVIDIYPGFPVLNCMTSETDCDAQFTLTGEFICNDPPPDWLPNTVNYFVSSTTQGGDASAGIPDIPQEEITQCIPFQGMYSLDIELPSTIENIYSSLDQVCEIAALDISAIESWMLEPRIGWSGALGTFNQIVEELIQGGSGDDLQNILERDQPRSGVVVFEVPEPGADGALYGDQDDIKDDVNLATEVSGRYDGLNHFVYTEDDGTVLTGLNIEVTASEEVLAGNVVGDSTIYFGVEAGQVLLAIANSGDIDGIGFCDNREYAPQ